MPIVRPVTPTNHTTFVVGAGASCEFGLKDGAALRDDIHEMVKSFWRESGQQFPHIPHWCGEPLPQEELNEAPEILLDTLPTSLSIDDCMHTHADHRGVQALGKWCIAWKILHQERKSCLLVSKGDRPQAKSFRPKIDHVDGNRIETDARRSWLTILFQNLTAQCHRDEIEQRLSRVSFIVFNYDRCIEHALAHLVCWKLGKRDMAEAQRVAKAATIIHPYGLAAPLNRDDYTRSPAFGLDPIERSVTEWAQGIRTFTEDADDSVKLAVRREIVKARNVVFLGFSFLSLNMQILAAEDRSQKRPAQRGFGTCLGMSEMDRRIAQTAADNRVLTQDGDYIELEDVTCADFMLRNKQAFGFTDPD